MEILNMIKYLWKS